MSRIVWKQHVTIENTPNSVYNIDDYRPKKKKFKLKYPKFYKPGERTSPDNAKLVIRYMIMTLDWKIIDKTLNDQRFWKAHLTLEDLEIIIGKALVSGYIKEAKKLFEDAKGIEKFNEISVSDAFYIDLKRRKKKPLKKFCGLILISLVRQGNYEAVEFALNNLSPDIDLRKVHVPDGDMTFSAWARHREIHELSSEEKLAEINPKQKVFDSFFEDETPLTALLKLHIGDHSKEVDPILLLLLDAGVNAFERNYQAFKVAAMCGLHQYIEEMLRYYKPKTTKGAQLFRKHLKSIYVDALGHSACENQNEVMHYVWKKLTKTKKGKKEKPGKSSRDKKHMIGIHIELAVAKIVRAGTSQNCTYRYRLLNGVFNLLTMKHLIETHEAMKIRAEEEESLSMGDAGIEDKLKEHQYLPISAWTKSEHSSLAVNQVVNYNAAFEALSDPSSLGLGAVLNRNFNVALAVDTLALGEGDGDGNSIHSGVSFATNSSSISRSGRVRKRTLIKPGEMFKWFLFMLQANDYNTENMGLVLFGLGLRPYIGKRRPRRKKSGESDAGSAWNMSQASESVMGDDRDDESDFEDNYDDDAPMGRGRESKRRRRSTLSNVADFFKDVGAKVVSKISTKDKISSKEKVLFLEAAAEFGSQPILSELLSLIAPDFSETLLKCCYLATIGGKELTQKILLDKVVDEISKVLNPESRDEKSVGSTLKGGKSPPSLNSYVKAFMKYKDQLDAIHQLSRQKDAFKGNRRMGLEEERNRVVGGKQKRKSLFESGRNLTRRLSQGANQLMRGTFGGGKAKRGPNHKSQRFNKKKKNERQKGIVKRAETKSNKRQPNQMQRRALQNKKHDSKSMKADGSALELAMNDFFQGLMEAACLYGSFGCCDNILSYPYAAKTECYEIILKHLREYCGPKPKRVKDAERYLTEYIRLLTKSTARTDYDFPKVVREVIDKATSSDTRTIENLTFILNRLSEVNNEPFLTINDLMYCIKLSVEGNTEWDHWAGLIKLIITNLCEEDREDLSEKLKSKIDRRLKGAMSRAVRDALDYENENGKGKLHVGRNKGGKNKRFSLTRKSLSRTRNRFGSLGGSFSKKRSKI